MWMNVSEFLFGSWDTKLLCSIKVGERREEILGSYLEPVVPWHAGPPVQRRAEAKSITPQTSPMPHRLLVAVVAVHEVGGRTTWKWS